jgi:hypothetical protein
MRYYTLHCDNCGNEVEKRGRPDALPAGTCCGQPMRILITPPLSIRLKFKPSHRQTALTRPNRER